MQSLARATPESSSPSTIDMARVAVIYYSTYAARGVAVLDLPMVLWTLPDLTRCAALLAAATGTSPSWPSGSWPAPTPWRGSRPSCSRCAAGAASPC